MTTMTTKANKSGNQTSDKKNGTDTDLTDEAKQLASNTVDSVQVAAEKVQEEAAHIADIAKDGFDHAKEMHQSTCDRVKKHPTASMLIAVGVGVVLGRIFGGR